MNKGIMSGMAPVKMQEGGEAQGLGSKIFKIGSDMANWATENPMDAALTGLMFVPGLGWGTGLALKALQYGSKANTLRKTKKTMDSVSKLSNPKTNKAGIGALFIDAGKNPEEYGLGGEESYSDMYKPGVAYYDPDNGYFEYDAEDDEIYLFENNQVPEGYTLGQ